MNLRLCDITGEIVRSPVDGTPTGILKDKAMDLIQKVIPPHSIEADDRALEAAMNHVAQYGVYVSRSTFLVT